MYHNFIFEELSGTKHFLRWNPSAVNFGYRTRTVYTPLDGPQSIMYQDSTEMVGTLVWQNVPVKKTQIYGDIAALQGKTGYLYTNVMPIFIGQKNMLRESSYNHLVRNNYYFLSCMATGYVKSDGSTIGPDGIEMVQCYARDAISHAGIPCIAGLADNTYQEHNVLSLYAKEKDAEYFALNLYDYYNAVSHYTRFRWVAGEPTVNAFANTDNGGADYIKNGWWRCWSYVDGATRNILGRATKVILYPHFEGDAEGYPIQSTYLTGFQLEHEVTEPTWFVATEGQRANERLAVEFTDMQTEYQDNLGVVRHTISLNFKIAGTYF